jgi:hypothetical protein
VSVDEDEVWKIISDFRNEVSDVAEVVERELTPRLQSVRFEPANPDAASIHLAVGERDVVAILGRASRFELGTDRASQELLRELLRAAEGGRVEETTRPFSVAYTVWLADGRRKTGRVSSLPDLWRRRSSREFGGKSSSRRYAPWRTSGASED